MTRFKLRLCRYCRTKFSPRARHEPYCSILCRFQANVDASAGIAGCWEWTSHTDPGGYGRIGINGKKDRAHRVAHILMKGPIPPGMYVCHSCDNRRCCNPAHLWLGSHQENIADCVQKGRNWKAMRLKKLTTEQLAVALDVEIPAAHAARLLSVTKSTIQKHRKKRVI